MNLFIYLLLISLAQVWADERCCEGIGCFTDNPPFSHLPLPRCPGQDFDPNLYILYTQSNPNTPIFLDKQTVPNEYDGSVETVILIHGYQNDESASWLRDMRDATLRLPERRNVIVVDWNTGARNPWYPQSASNTRSVAADLNVLVQNLIEKGGSSSSRMYCVGHSLGAHTCGHMGRLAKIGRITGLDPAGPMFEWDLNGNELDPRCGLYTDCAEFVDILHTNGASGILVPFGTMRPIGHMDFYPNGADRQPGCITFSGSHSRRKRQIDVSCSHGRANTYFTESVLTNCFKARQICSDENDLPGSCWLGYAEMGFHARDSGHNGIYYLETNDSSPFCQN